MTALQRVDRAYGWLLAGIAGIGAAVLLLLVGLVTIDVTLRSAVASGIHGSVEFAEIGLYLATVTAAPWLLHRSAHIRADIVLQVLPKRLGWGLELAAESLGIVVLAVLLPYAVGIVGESRALGSMVRRAITFPEWWLLAPLPLCLGLLLGAQGFRMARLLKGPREPSQTDLSAA